MRSVVRELDVAAHERLREAVDRGERGAELVRDRGDEVRLHLLDHALAGDIAEGEDAAGDGPARVEHDRLAEREPDLLVAALDRERALAGRRAVLRREIALQDLRHAAPERFLGRDAADLLGGRVPQDDVPVAVDGDDAVRDVGEDRLAPLLLFRDSLVELGAREDRRRSRGECRERLDFVLAPGPHGGVVDREHAAQAASVEEHRDGDAGDHPVREQRVFVREPRRLPRIRDGVRSP